MLRRCLRRLQVPVSGVASNNMESNLRKSTGNIQATRYDTMPQRYTEGTLVEGYHRQTPLQSHRAYVDHNSPWESLKIWVSEPTPMFLLIGMGIMMCYAVGYNYMQATEGSFLYTNTAHLSKTTALQTMEAVQVYERLEQLEEELKKFPKKVLVKVNRAAAGQEAENNLREDPPRESADDATPMMKSRTAPPAPTGYIASSEFHNYSKRPQENRNSVYYSSPPPTAFAYLHDTTTPSGERMHPELEIRQLQEQSKGLASEVQETLKQLTETRARVIRMQHREMELAQENKRLRILVGNLD